MKLGVVCLIALGLGSAEAADIDWNAIDYDPLRRFIPDPKLFTPVPAGSMAVKIEADESDTFEAKRDSRNGGLIYGYCLTSSCSYITHIVVEQVCANHVGGKGNEQRLVLGVIKMPYGGRPGYLWSLTGRNYAENFQLYGPYEQILTNEEETEYRIIAQGMGAVAPLAYEGNEPAAVQDRATRTFQLDVHQRFRIFEVRHLCRSPLS